MIKHLPLIGGILIVLGGVGIVGWHYFKNHSPESPNVTCSLSPLHSSKVDNFLLGFTSLKNVSTNEEMPISGKVPSWLSGTLYRVGPGQFEINNSCALHWLDGFAMVYRFAFEKGKITYSNALLNSNYYNETCKSGVMKGPQAKSGKNNIYDNVNLNIATYGSQLVALTETPSPVTFNPVSLATECPFVFDDSIEAQFATAHPHFDPKTNTYYGFLINFARSSEYILYSMNAKGHTRKKIGSTKVSQPAYMHSFAVTDRYLILTEHPFVVKPIRFLFGNKPFLDHFSWKPNQGTTFLVFDKAQGNLVGKYKTDAFFALHHINAFDEGKKITLDIAAYEDPSILKAYSFDSLCKKKKICFPHAHLHRFVIDLNKGTVNNISGSVPSIEMPRINYDTYNGKPYKYAYGISSDTEHAFANQIIKIEVDSEAYLTWQEPHCYPSEPVFVAAPKGKGEDEGVLLSLVLDTKKRNSFILILDAHTMRELARATVPHHIPFTVHGMFMPSS